MKIKLKKINNISIVLVMLIFMNSYAALLVQNDGSAFITKAEFDTLKNDFQSRLNEFNTGIDTKIENAISAYLEGALSDVKKSFKVSNDLSYPLTCLNGSAFSGNESKNIDAKYNTSILFNRNDCIAWTGALTYKNPNPTSGSKITNFIIVDDSSSLVTGDAKNVNFNMSFLNYGYAYTAALDNFNFIVFYNGSGYDPVDIANHTAASLTFSSTNFSNEKFIKTNATDTKIITNYMFRYHTTSFSLTNLTWNTATWGTTAVNNCYKNEMGVAPASFLNLSTKISLENEPLHTVTNNNDTVLPIMFQKSDKSYYANLVLIPKEGYPEIKNITHAWRYWNGGGEQVQASNAFLRGIVWPSFSIYTSSHSGASSTWYNCSAAKSSLLKYNITDTVTGAVSQQEISDGIYLGTAEVDGKVTIELEFSNTGSNNKKIMFHKQPIQNDGAGVSSTYIHRFSVGSSTVAPFTTVTSDTFSGSTLNRTYVLPDVKKGEKIYMKTICTSNFEYMQKPKMMIIY